MMIAVILTVSILSLIFLWLAFRSEIVDLFCSTIVKYSKRYRCRRHPKRIILIRHGESQGNQDSTIYCSVPDHAIGLTEKGRTQAVRCGQELRKLIGNKETLACFVSPFRRSKETCDLICEAFPEENILKVREDPRIREQEW
jgi:hypothetical protein